MSSSIQRLRNCLRRAEQQAGYSSVGRASDCRLLQKSDGPWFDSGWPEGALAVIQVSRIGGNEFDQQATQAAPWLPLAFLRGGARGDQLAAVGFEPTPFRHGALSHRLRPLGQPVLELRSFVKYGVDIERAGPEQNHRERIAQVRRKWAKRGAKVRRSSQARSSSDSSGVPTHGLADWRLTPAP